jgi:CDP-6-deoxy-D-xylo-4-hexulose-3-dehydrase
MKYLDAIVPAELPAADKVHVDGLFVGNHHYPVEGGLDLLKATLESVAR